ncbi:restriction endonuclease subunit S [Bacteroides fragilis]|uniref:restriction endonuclease subunit S n=1 Tax=Bacteroides fragilis TaxID=817 RepID=UPI0022AB3368|nr:restriction endonuclease subunit S [Bacteroides fragilis]MCZ2618834.1 restriction endonuclease subunit S [Bacteroides fragilis]
MADNKNNSERNVPHLRFPEFTDEWKESVLSDFVERVKRKNKNNLCKLPLTISAQYGLVDQISFFNKVIASENMSNYYLLHKGDFAYNKSYSSEYPWGAIKRLDCYEQGTLSSLYICFKPYSHVSSDFLTHYFETSKWHQGISEIAVEGARNHGLLNVGIQDFFETRHCLPQSLLEQEKIAKFLNLIEERIATQNKIIEDLKKLKSAIVDKLYSSAKGETYSFRQLFEVVNEKNKKLIYSNVLSASQELGMIERSDINIDIKFEQNSISEYKIVRKGDYVVHLRSFQGGFAFSDRTGICSPAYTILHPNDLVAYGYLSHFFISKPFIKSLKLVTYGIRDGRSINVDEWLDMTVTLPTKREQSHILAIINAIDNKLHNENQIHNYMFRQRTYLLKTMFI